MTNRSLLKTILLGAFILAGTLFCDAHLSEGRMRKTIRQYDVAYSAYAQGVCQGPNAFWTAVEGTDPGLLRYFADMQRNSRATRGAIRRYEAEPRFFSRYCAQIDWKAQPYCDSILTLLGADPSMPDCSIHIVLDPLPAVATVPTEEGRAILISSQLLAKPGWTDEMFLAIAAHEYAHGILRHPVRSHCIDIKNERKNRWAAAGIIAAGIVLTAADAYVNDQCAPGSTVNNYIYVAPPANGYEPPAPPAAEAPVSVLSTFQYNFKPEQVLQADLVAFRFMETRGQGQAYIESLRFMGYDYDLCFEGINNHPDTNDRIALLEYARSHPDVKPKHYRR